MRAETKQAIFACLSLCFGASPVMAAPLDCEIHDRSQAPVSPGAASGNASAAKAAEANETVTTVHILGSSMKVHKLKDGQHSIKVGRYLELVQIALAKTQGDETLVLAQTPVKNFTGLDLTLTVPDAWVNCRPPETGRSKESRGK